MSYEDRNVLWWKECIMMKGICSGNGNVILLEGMSDEDRNVLWWWECLRFCAYNK